MQAGKPLETVSLRSGSADTPLKRGVNGSGVREYIRWSHSLACNSPQKQASEDEVFPQPFGPARTVMGWMLPGASSKLKRSASIALYFSMFSSRIFV